MFKFSCLCNRSFSSDCRNARGASLSSLDLLQSSRCDLHPHSLCSWPGHSRWHHDRWFQHDFYFFVIVMWLFSSYVSPDLTDPVCLGSSAMATTSTTNGSHHPSACKNLKSWLFQTNLKRAFFICHGKLQFLIWICSLGDIMVLHPRVSSMAFCARKKSQGNCIGQVNFSSYSHLDKNDNMQLRWKNSRQVNFSIIFSIHSQKRSANQQQIARCGHNGRDSNQRQQCFEKVWTGWTFPPTPGSVFSPAPCSLRPSAVQIVPISRFAFLCSNCSIMSLLCYNVQIISLYQMKNTLLLLLLWPITALGYYGLALSMSSIGFQFCIFTPHKYNYDQNLMNG